jgi:protease I
MPANLNGKKIAILTAIGFEEVELTSLKKALEEAGAELKIVSPQPKIATPQLKIATPATR